MCFKHLKSASKICPLQGKKIPENVEKSTFSGTYTRAIDGARRMAKISLNPNK